MRASLQILLTRREPPTKSGRECGHFLPYNSVLNIPLTSKIDVFSLRGGKPNFLGVLRRYNPNPNALSYNERQDVDIQLAILNSTIEIG